MKKVRILKKIFIIGMCVGAIGLIALLLINSHIKNTVSNRIVSMEDISDKDIDCILVLGCQVWDSGQPSHMLRDRLTRGIELYENDISEKLLMSGDHGQIDYNEVQAMKQFAMDKGIQSSDIFMDHAGFSTYESIYRAKEIFGVQKMVIVTQEYHLYRALYIAEQFDIEAYGVSSDYNRYMGQTMRDVREVLARAKDFATTIIRPEPTYLGDKIDIHGDGDVTND